MFSSSLSMKMVPSKEEEPKDSSEKKKSNDNYVQGYNYHWEFHLGSPYLPKTSSEEKADGMD